VEIDGYSQPGAAPSTDGSPAVLRIELDGSNAGADTHGLTIATSGSRVRGLVINDFTGCGIYVDGSNNDVQGNYIGTDVTGTMDVGNSSGGVWIWNSQANTIGGNTPAERNIISGNDGPGVYIFVGSGNDVRGNYIGTDVTGTMDVGNSHEGVVILFSEDNTIGGNTPGERNIISGNDDPGVVIANWSSNNYVQGNYIGTDVTGTAQLGNSGDGVLIVESHLNTIGGTTTAERNVISGNGDHGVSIYGGNRNDVRGNYIGTDVSGTAQLGNSHHGVHIDESYTNTIGGNIISGNDVHGVYIYGCIVPP
ncbi:NosD domain-containing protein, partial [Chloroflexota bacterium]